MDIFRKSLIYAIVFVFLGPVEIFAFDYVINDFTIYPTPNIPRPPKGVTFQDSLYHTNITRITDALIDTPGSKWPYLQAGYPKHDIENADASMLVLQGSGAPGWHIFNPNPPYNRISGINYYLGSTGQAIDFRWDSVDPNKGYYQYRCQFWKYDVALKKGTPLYDFRQDFVLPENTTMSFVSMQEEGCPSDDCKYWAFRVQYHSSTHNPTYWVHALIVFDKDFYGPDQGKVISVIDETHPDFKPAGFTSMDRTGNYVWIGDTHRFYKRDFSSYVNPGITGHADLAMSKEGRQVLFGFKNKGGSNYWAVMWDLESHVTTWLAPIGLPRYHFSGNAYDKPGWGVVCTFKISETSPFYNDREVIMVELTTRTDPPPRVWRICKDRTLYAGYADGPFAKINRKGTKIWFGSNWGTPLRDGGQYDVFQVNLPSTWYQDLSAGVFPPATGSPTPSIPTTTPTTPTPTTTTAPPSPPKGIKILTSP